MVDIGSVWLLLFVVGGLYLLIRGADHLVDGASALALQAGVSPLLIGLTIVAFGTSAPELATCLRAVVREASFLPGGAPTASQFALGNVVGSNIANLAFVLATAMFFGRMNVESSLIRRELPFLAALTLGFVVLVETAGLPRVAGVGLLAAFLAFCAWTSWETIQQSRESKRRRLESEAELEVDVEALQLMSGWTALGLVGLGLVVLTAGAELLVQSSTALALRLHVPDEFIGLTIVAIGTSLPELATTLVAARKGSQELGLGNIIGSNVFNIGLVVGLPATLYGWPVDPVAIRFDLFVMLGLTLVVIAAGSIRKGLGKKLGVVLLTAYVLYMTVLTVGVIGPR